jgi:hypothetical protein
VKVGLLMMEQSRTNLNIHGSRSVKPTKKERENKCLTVLGESSRRRACKPTHQKYFLPRAIGKQGRSEQLGTLARSKKISQE